jgi:5'-nucleotidase
MKQAVSEHHMLVLDIGDHMDRMRLETEGSMGLLNIEAMNETGYDAMVLGNNEGLTFTPETLKQMFEHRANFHIVTSNLLDSHTHQFKSWMKPYVIIEKAGLSFGIIGVTVAFRVYYELLGWEVLEPLPTIAQYVKQLRDQVDVLIVCSHLGLSMDQQMAHDIPGIDLILGGHTHHLLEQPLIIGSTSICAAGKLGHYMGQVVISFDASSKHIHDVQCSLVDMGNYTDHPEMVSLIEKYRNSSEQQLAVVVAPLSEDLLLDQHRESPLGNLVATGLRKWTDAEIGLFNSGQLLDGLKAGKVTRSKLLEICPGPINPCRVKLRGTHLLQALEESLLHTFRSQVIRGFGFRGDILGALCVDGLRIEYDSMRPEMNQITAVYVNGQLLQLDREYLVGTIDMFTFGVGYISLSYGTEIKYVLPEFLRDVLASQLLDPLMVEQSKISQHWMEQS